MTDKKKLGSMSNIKNGKGYLTIDPADSKKMVSWIIYASKCEIPREKKLIKTDTRKNENPE